MGGDSSPCSSVYGLIYLMMANDLRFWVGSPKQLSLAGRMRDMVQTDMSGRNNGAKCEN